jgi:hypothetical protein
MFILFLTKNYKIEFSLGHNSAIHFKTKRRTHTYQRQAHSQKLCVLNETNKCWSCHISEAINRIVKYVIDFDVFIIRAKQWCLLSFIRSVFYTYISTIVVIKSYQLPSYNDYLDCNTMSSIKFCLMFC